MKKLTKKLDQFIKKDLLPIINKPLEVYSKLYELYRKGRIEKNYDSCQIIQALNNKYDVDVCFLGKKSIDEGYNCWNVLHILRDSIPYLKINVDSFIALLKSFNLNMQNDFATGGQYTPVSMLAREQPETCSVILNKMLENPEACYTGYVSTILFEFSKNNFDKVYEETINLTSHNSIDIRQAAITALGGFEYELPRDNSLLQRSLDTLSYIQKEEVVELDLAIIHSLGLLLTKTDRVKSYILNYASKDNPNIRCQVSRILFFNVENNCKEEWFKEALSFFINTSYEHIGIIEYIDFILAEILKTACDWEFVESFLLKWVLGSDISSQRQVKFEKLIDSTLPVYMENKEKLSRLITNWFNHDDRKVHRIVAEVITFISSHGVVDLKLDIEVIDKLNIDDIIYIIRKILGYVNNPSILCSLIYSLLEKKEGKDQVADLVIGVFKDHIGRKFPHKVIEFMKMQLTKDISNGYKKAVADKIIECVESYMDIRKSLPRLKELYPSRQNSYLIVIEQKKEMSEVYEEVQKSSILSMLATKISLKCGRGSFGWYQDKYSAPTFLKSFSTSVDVPISEIAYPVSSAMERLGYQLAKRGDK